MSKKLAGWVFLVSVTATFGLAQSETATGSTPACDCSRFPFKPDPPCLAECTTALLAIANENELTGLFQLDTTSANEVTLAADGVDSVNDNLLSKLKPAQQQSLMAAFQNLTQQDLQDYLTKKKEDPDQRIQRLLAEISSAKDKPPEPQQDE